MTNDDTQHEPVACPIVPYGGPLPYPDEWDAIFAGVDIHQATELHQARLRATYGTTFEAQSCAERVDPPPSNGTTFAIDVTTKPFLTTREATAYCGFKTAGALRKAKLEGRIAPAGRRGGTGTLMWSREALDRYLQSNAPATVRAGRARTPPEATGGTHDEASVGSEVEQLGGGATDSARSLSTKGGRVPGSRASGRSEERSDAAGCPKPAGPSGTRGGPPLAKGGARLDSQGREPADEQAARALCDVRRFLAERKS